MHVLVARADRRATASVMSSTFGLRYHENQATERKKVDLDRQKRNMLRLKKMRGKHAFWQNLQVMLLFARPS
jgi:hypothetical protein